MILNHETLIRQMNKELPVTVFGLTEYGAKLEWTGIVRAQSVWPDGSIKLWVADTSFVLTEAYFYEPGTVFHGPEDMPAVEVGEDIPAELSTPNPERVALMKSWGMEVK